MANQPVERELTRRRSWAAVLAAFALVALAVPAVRAQRAATNTEGVTPAVGSTTTIDPAAVGVRRLSQPLDREDVTLGAIGFRTGSVAIIVAAERLLVVDLDRDIVGLVEPRPIGDPEARLDYLGRSVAIAQTSTGVFEISADGSVVRLGLDPGPADGEIGRTDQRCGDPCDQLLVRPLGGGSWTARFGDPLEPGLIPVVSRDGNSVAAWVRGPLGLRLEIATPDEYNVVPFSSEGTGAPAMTSWTSDGDGLAYARVGEARVQVYSPTRRATGTIWLDDEVLAAALLSAE